MQVGVQREGVEQEQRVYEDQGRACAEQSSRQGKVDLVSNGAG